MFVCRLQSRLNRVVFFSVAAFARREYHRLNDTIATPAEARTELLIPLIYALRFTG